MEGKIKAAKNTKYVSIPKIKYQLESEKETLRKSLEAVRARIVLASHAAPSVLKTKKFEELIATGNEKISAGNTYKKDIDVKLK